LPGELTLIGFALALVSLALVSASGGPIRDLKGLPQAIGAGLGFGVFFILIANVESEAVFLPLAIARFASSTLMITIALTTRRLRLPDKPIVWLAILLAGTCDIVGNTFFSLAERGGRLDIAGVLSSLYPAVTILWAFVISRERIGRLQVVGIVAGLIAIMLIAL
jgi:drug/metabolite transporter (DMT)-like permease